MSFKDNLKNVKKNAASGKSSKTGGFKQAVKNVQAEQGLSEDEAAAIIASASRNASPAAKKKNPKLNRVK